MYISKDPTLASGSRMCGHGFERILSILFQNLKKALRVQVYRTSLIRVKLKFNIQTCTPM